MKPLLTLLLLTTSHFSRAQAASEIYLFDFDIANLELSHGVNISQHPGYDNQPLFHPSKPVIYYSSFNEQGRSDIKFYHYLGGTTSNLTSTPEREYSPTPTLDGKYISCIIQRDNGAQELGQYPIAGGEVMTLVDDLVVGYHAWVNEKNLLLFVLGEPSTLRWYDLETKENEVLQSNVGRSLHRVPGKKSISFVYKPVGEDWRIMQWDYGTRKISTLIPTLPGREDLCWTPNGEILMSDGEVIYIRNPDSPATEWKPLSLNLPLKEISRLAMSPDGKKLAVVAAE